MAQKYASVQDLAVYFGVSIPTIHNWAGDGPYSIPDFPRKYHLGSQTVRFRWDEIEAWEASRAQEDAQ